MNKIIRVNGILTEKQYENIKIFLKNNRIVEFYPICIVLKTKDKKDSNLIMEIDEEYDKKLLFYIKYNGKIILKENFLFIENIIGLITIKKSPYILFINIDREHTEDEIIYYKEKFKTLKHKFYFERTNDTGSMYNQIMYCDFNDEDELLIATYCLLILSSYNYHYENYHYETSINLYKQKLNYIGYDIENFYNKNNKYSFEEFKQVEKEFNSSKDILIYLIGLINFIGNNNIVIQDLYKSNLDNIFLKYFLLKF